jgi:hypothetical protein
MNTEAARKIAQKILAAQFRADPRITLETAKTIAARVSSELQEGMLKQGFVCSGPAFSVEVTAIDGGPRMTATITAKDQEAENYLLWALENHPEVFGDQR